MPEKTLLEYWFALYERRGVILIITLSAMISAWVLSEWLDPVYEAKAVFFVPKTPDATVFFDRPGGSMVRSPLVPEAAGEKQKPYVGILKSKTIAELVQKDFPQKSIREIQKNLDLDPTNEFLIRVYARDKDPAVAAGIANAYVKYFNRLLGEYSLPSQSGIEAALEAELSSNKRKLAEAFRAQEEFQRKNRTANLDEETKQVISLKTTFESQLGASQVQHKEVLEKILATQRELEKERLLLKPSEFVVASRLLDTLRSKFADLESQMAELKADLKESHPQLVALKQNYEEVKSNITKEIERIINSQVQAPDSHYESLRRQLVSLYVDRERLQANIKATENVIRATETRIVEIPSKKNQVGTFNDQIKMYKDREEALSLDLQEVRLQAKRPLQVAVMVDRAISPRDPVFPIPWLNVLVALVAGLVGSIFYAFFVDYLERTREKRLYSLLKAIEASDE